MVEISEFNEMFEKNPLAQVVIDADLKILMANDAFAKMVGYSKDRLLAIRISDLRSQNMIKYLKDSGETIQDAITTKRVSHGQSTLETPTGTHVIVRANIPLLDERGNVKYVYVTYNEITKIVKSADFMAGQVDILSGAYGKMAAGDLTVRVELLKPDEDTKDVYEQIIKLRDAVRGIVISLEKNIGDVNNQMTNLTATTDNAAKSVEDASKSVNQIAKNAGVVSENAQKSSEGIEQMSKAMQDMSAAVE